MMKVKASALRRLGPLGLAAILGIAVVSGCATRGSSTNQVVVYTAEKEEIIQAVAEMWAKAEPDIRLNTLAAGTNEVVQRVRAEAQRPLGDVIWGIGAEGMSAHPELFEPYETKEHAAIDPRWLAVAEGEPWQPNNVVPMVVVYNTRLARGPGHTRGAPLIAPQRWRDLALFYNKGLLAYAAPDKSGSAYTQLATMVSIFGDNEAGWKIIEQIMANAKILQSSGKVIKGVADGEYAIGITYENIAGLYKRSGAPIEIVYPAEGTAVTPDGNALIRGAPHPAPAKRFLDFLLSKAVQEMLAEKLSLRSVRTDVASPPGLSPIDEIKPAPGFDFRSAAQHQKDYLEKWQAVLLRIKQ
ncbi:MAG: extracellular solute-binding protein [Armatimonadota bacterium]|nr:MAG: extracellular solute-binding protein [Armatimonadota bacterium]